ncbi:ras association domain-containing protein 7-like isoform X2 [Leuresthes tenuis]|uniref:ras association domain-containing protein 7-like isoform X2 n=1 Tax=Leuresthes tenuis TaxID=355514 RepID=UPI003B5122FC
MFNSSFTGWCVFLPVCRSQVQQSGSMELKVWVEGVVRVVCGLSLSTSCQDVVIALAKANSQTGRYVLILKLRGNERHLLPDECPLQHLTQLGQLAAEVQFILWRTGPSLSEDPHTATREKLTPLLRPSEPEPRKHTGPQKALTFNLGPSTFPKRTKPDRAWSPSPEPRRSPVAFLNPPTSVHSCPSYPPKEEVFRQILQQQSRLQDLEGQIEALERQTELWEQESSSASLHEPTPVLAEELEELERRQRQNELELTYGDGWEEDLQAEMEREQDMLRRLEQIHSSIDDQSYENMVLQSRSAHLEQDLQLRSQAESPQEEAQQTDEALRSLTEELHSRLQLGEELDAESSQTQWELQTAEERVRLEKLEELKKELRQSNLQQFVKKTGVTLHADQRRSLPVNEVYLSNAGIMK